MWKVYILKSNKGNWYYVGSTNDIERRLKEHNYGKVQSTKNHVPLHLVYSKDFEDEKSAREYEKKVKSKRLLKESIIRSIQG